MDPYDELRTRCFDPANDLPPEEQIHAYGEVITANRSKEDVERAHFLRGIYRVDFQGDFERAIEDFTKAIALTPNPRYFQNRGEALSARGQSDAALADFARVIELDPDSASPHLCAGTIYLHDGKPGQAIECFDRAIAISPDYAAAYYNRSLAHLDLGSREAAARDLDKSIEVDPAGDGLYRGIRGAQALRQGDAVRALPDLERALDYVGDLPMLLYLRAIARRKLGDSAAADADFAEARRLSPTIDREMAADGFVP